MAGTHGYLTPRDSGIMISIPQRILLFHPHKHLQNESITYTTTNGTVWHNSYGGPGWDQGGYVVQTPDNGFILTGTTAVIGPSTMQSWLVKTDSEGVPQWSKTYPDTLYEIESIILTSDNGFVFTGMNVLMNTVSAGLVKIDSSGTILWNHTFANTPFQLSHAVVEAADGGFILTGSIWPNDFQSISWVAKTNASGTFQWERTYDLNNGHFANTIITTADTGFTMAGTYHSYHSHGLQNSDFLLAKTDNNGTLKWNKTYGGNYTDEWVKAGIQTSKGDIILVGTTDASGTRDVLLVKTDIQGNLLWHRTYGGKGEDKGVSIVETSDGNFVILGSTNSFGTGGNDIWLIKTNANGQLLWEQTYGGTQDETGSIVIETKEENIVLIGTSQSFGRSEDVWLVNIDPSKIIASKINSSEISEAEISSFVVSVIEISSSEVTTPVTSSSEVTTPVTSSSEVTTPVTSSSEVTTPVTSSPEAITSEISMFNLMVITILAVIATIKVWLKKR